MYSCNRMMWLWLLQPDKSKDTDGIVGQVLQDATSGSYTCMYYVCGSLPFLLLSFYMLTCTCTMYMHLQSCISLHCCDSLCLGGISCGR